MIPKITLENTKERILYYLAKQGPNTDKLHDYIWANLINLRISYDQIKCMEYKNTTQDDIVRIYLNEGYDYKKYFQFLSDCNETTNAINKVFEDFTLIIFLKDRSWVIYDYDNDLKRHDFIHHNIPTRLSHLFNRNYMMEFPAPQCERYKSQNDRNFKHKIRNQLDYRLKAIFDELEKKAYNLEFHNYNYKYTNQIIREHFEKLFKEGNDDIKFIIKSGPGFFIKIVNDTPQMTSDYIEAERFDTPDDAINIMKILSSLGYSVELIKLKIGRIT